jgi:hypothetical protein
MEKKIVRLSEYDLEKLVQRLVREEGEQLSLDFPGEDLKHPFLKDIESKIDELKIHDKLEHFIDVISNTSISRPHNPMLERQLSHLETDIKNLEHLVYSNEELPNGITYPIGDKLSNLLDICHDLQGLYTDMISVKSTLDDIIENFEQIK